MDYHDTIRRSDVEHNENWNKIIPEIPTLKFKQEWDVKIIPPFAGAIIRFMIFKEGVQVCSVYLDWYDRLGMCGEPYYELYPFENDVKRYSLNETEELLKDIEDLFND